MMRSRDPGREVAALVVAVVLGMSPWFSATVVAPAIVRELGQPETVAVWLTLAVQLGFVLGSLASAVFLLPDRLSPRRFAAVSALVAAAATAALALPWSSLGGAVALRIVAGAALAGVYPPGIKMAAGWTNRRRGLAIGWLVGGTTLGAAVPHLLRLGPDPEHWRPVVLLAAACAALSAVLFGFRVREGPYQAPSAPFDPHVLRQVFRNRGVMLATGGYLGHMWELYAMWSSIGLYWSFVAAQRGWSANSAGLAAFATVAAGVLGCVHAGVVADRVGRATVTMVAMGISGICAVIIGPLSGSSAFLLIPVELVWGASIVADSAQFSTAVTEFANHEYVGTAVTVQTALGFLLTMVTITFVPSWSVAWGWTWAYVPLALGPLAGILCMWRLRNLEQRTISG